MANRVEKYEVKIINDLREDKKLLVLDIDYTLFDHKTPAETGAELMRPYLHEFLTSAYKVRTQYVQSFGSQTWRVSCRILMGKGTGHFRPSVYR